MSDVKLDPALGCAVTLAVVYHQPRPVRPVLPPATARQIARAARANRPDLRLVRLGSDLRDVIGDGPGERERATWPMRERMPGEPPC